MCPFLPFDKAVTSPSAVPNRTWCQTELQTNLSRQRMLGQYPYLTLEPFIKAISPTDSCVSSVKVYDLSLRIGIVLFSTGTGRVRTTRLIRCPVDLNADELTNTYGSPR
jgi:hypothetical protein